jgi:hypothetical protein
LSNYRFFRANLRAPLVTVELSFDGRFELEASDADILIQISGGAVLWQKERLLNLALKALSPDVRRVAWIDCDLILKRVNWVEEANRQLDKFAIVQLFSDAVHLTLEDYQSSSLNGSAQEVVPAIIGLPHAREFITVKSNSNYYQSGFAWAANRELMEEHQFYDAAIVGGGDCMMVAAILGQFDGIADRFLLNKARRRHYLDWAIPFHRSVAERVGQVPGTIFHLTHGDLKHRKYADRHVSLAAFHFDPGLDLRIGGQGAWEWARPRPDLEAFMKSYFVERAEDS